MPDGVDVIKNIFKSTDDKKGVDITYEGAGKYRLKIKSTDYKTGEKILENITEKVLDQAKEKDCECGFVRDEDK